jgi:LysR family transcriptional regulator for metE and metH
MRLEVRDLRLVDAIAAAGSVTRASRRLNVTQPALSKHLRALEDRFAEPLFNRGARLEPTALGAQLLGHARSVLERLDAAETDLVQAREAPRRIVRVGTDCYTGYHWLPEAIRSFRNRHMDTELEIAFEAARRPLQMVRSGEIDLALVTEAPAHAGVVAMPLFSDEYVAVVTPTHPLAREPFLRPESLEGERVLLISPPQGSTVVRNFIKPSRVKPKQLADVQLIGAMAALVQGEYGIGMVPNWVIAPEVRAGRLTALRLGRSGLRRTWMAVVSRKRAGESWFKAFVKLVTAGSPPSVLP